MTADAVAAFCGVGLDPYLEAPVFPEAELPLLAMSLLSFLAIGFPVVFAGGLISSVVLGSARVAVEAPIELASLDISFSKLKEPIW